MKTKIKKLKTTIILLTTSLLVVMLICHEQNLPGKQYYRWNILSFRESIDTLKAGDTLKTVTYSTCKVISYSIKQVDTNLTFPDSVAGFTQIANSFLAPAQFFENGDTTHFLTFTYGTNYIALGSTGQIRSGWVYKPTTPLLVWWLYNKKYLSNRKLIVNTYFYY